MTKKNQGFEITEKHIDTALRYLKFEKGIEEPTREEAVTLLEDHLALAHMLAHKLVDDEQSGEIEKVEIKETTDDEIEEEAN